MLLTCPHLPFPRFALQDFDVQVQRSFGPPTVEDSGQRGGKYRVRTDGAVHATINGGGSAIQFTNLSGNIDIRKAGGAHQSALLTSPQALSGRKLCCRHKPRT
jgi:hypothetical protein